MATETTYALIGDIVDSRKISERHKAARQIESALTMANEYLQDDLLAPLRLTQGVDEISGVLKRPSEILTALHLINGRIWPYQLRLAIGEGSVDDLTGRRDAGLMDGPGFHKAAEGMKRAKSKKLPLTIELHDQREKAAIEAIETIAKLTKALSAGWKEASVNVFNLLMAEKTSETTQTQLAKRLKISQQAVSKLMMRSHFKDLKKAQRSVANLFEDILYKPIAS